MTTDIDTNTIGSRIKKLRIQLGLSQRDIQTKYASYAYISRIEADERTPSSNALRSIAEKLNTTAHYLEYGDGYNIVNCPHCGRSGLGGDKE